MLSAYLGWASTAPGEELQATFPYLWMVDHLGPDEPLAPPSLRGTIVPQRPCTDLDCRRCTNRWGGYQFRWIDRRWLDQYEGMRRPGSWTSR